MPEISLLFSLSIFIAGFLMFLAPCTFPLIPGFLAVLAGGKKSKNEKLNIISNTVAFCFGFTLIFILFGIGASTINIYFADSFILIKKFSGILVIIFGLMILGFIKPYFFIGQKTLVIPRFIQPGTLRSSFLLGSVFSIGWSPCIGPIMASVLLIAANGESVLMGIFVLTLFSLGFSLPLVLSAVFYQRISHLVRPYERFNQLIKILSGLILLVLGVLLLLGDEGLILVYGTKLFYLLRLDFLFNYY